MSKFKEYLEATLKKKEANFEFDIRDSVRVKVTGVDIDDARAEEHQFIGEIVDIISNLLSINLSNFCTIL